MIYAINEIFYSIQGEAEHTGTPAVFIRFQGCGVGCGWCDTKHTWQKEKKYLVSPDNMIVKTGDSPAWCDVTSDWIADYLADIAPRGVHVVLTGGEPLEQDLQDLCELLTERGHYIQIETSGTVLIPEWAYENHWITLSPKIGMKKPVLNANTSLCHEIKMPVGKEKDLQNLDEYLDSHMYLKPPIWLQPLSQNEKSTKLCLETCMERNWRLSLQTHKYLSVR